MTTTTQTAKRIRTKGHVVRVQTELGTAVTITKREAYRLLDTLESRGVEPEVEFTDIGNGREFVYISS